MFLRLLRDMQFLLRQQLHGLLWLFKRLRFILRFILRFCLRRRMLVKLYHLLRRQLLVRLFRMQRKLSGFVRKGLRQRLLCYLRTRLLVRLLRLFLRVQQRMRRVQQQMRRRMHGVVQRLLLFLLWLLKRLHARMHCWLLQ